MRFFKPFALLELLITWLLVVGGMPRTVVGFVLLILSAEALYIAESSASAVSLRNKLESDGLILNSFLETGTETAMSSGAGPDMGIIVFVSCLVAVVAISAVVAFRIRARKKKNAAGNDRYVPHSIVLDESSSVHEGDVLRASASAVFYMNVLNKNKQPIPLEEAPRMQCAMDDELWQDCEGYWEVSHLTPGQHTFAARTVKEVSVAGGESHEEVLQCQVSFTVMNASPAGTSRFGVGGLTQAMAKVGAALRGGPKKVSAGKGGGDGSQHPVMQDGVLVPTELLKDGPVDTVDPEGRGVLVSHPRNTATLGSLVFGQAGLPASGGIGPGAAVGAGGHHLPAVGSTRDLTGLQERMDQEMKRRMATGSSAKNPAEVPTEDNTVPSQKELLEFTPIQLRDRLRLAPLIRGELSDEQIMAMSGAEVREVYRRYTVTSTAQLSKGCSRTKSSVTKKAEDDGCEPIPESDPADVWPSAGDRLTRSIAARDEKVSAQKARLTIEA